jgi:hypothetical protein
MVKSALTRAGVPHGDAALPKTPELEPLRAKDILGPRSAPVREVPAEPVLAKDSESFVDEVPARPAPVRIDSGSQPVAFGSLLETPTVEAEDDAAFLPPANPELATERDWRDPDAAEEEEEEEEKPAPAWRREETETFAESASQAGGAGWRGGSFEQIDSKRSQYEAWESQQEKPTVAEAAKAPQEISAGVKEMPQSPTVVSEPIATIPTLPSSANLWAPAATTISQPESSAKTATAVEDVAHTPSHEHVAPERASVSAAETQPAPPEEKSATNSWFSTPASPWDSEIEKANRLASAWDSPVSVPSTPAASNGTEPAPVEASEVAKAIIEQAALPAATVEAIREEAAQVAEDVVKSAVEPVAVEASITPQPAAIEAPAPTPSMDDLVAKVLANMSPEVLQAVTREILKPVVEAMVKEELKGKKS